MIESKYQKQIDKFKAEHIGYVKRTLSDTGKFDAAYLMLSLSPDGTTNIGMMPVPPELMQNAQSKKIIAEMIIPKLNEIVQEKGDIILCITWSSEIWIRKVSREEYKDMTDDDYQNTPKEEGIMVTFETAHSSEIIVYNMIREGKKLNEDGDIIDDITLVENKELTVTNSSERMEGTFVNLFRKFTNSNN